jgi:probable addiction module antidote protein
MEPTAAARPGIKPFEAADDLQSGEECAQYLQACMDEAPEDAALFTKAVGDVARARGMMQLARDTGITREGLYKALGEQGNPSFAGTAVQRGRAIGAGLTTQRVLLCLSRVAGPRQLGKLCRHRGVAPCELLDRQVVGLVVGEPQIVR